jgi:hypothetical protein
METKKYYLPISSTSLAHYFGCACIKPSRYFDNKPKDLQDKLSDFLLITTHFGTGQTDCCLELVFTEQEIDDLIPTNNDGFFLYEKPLPITRVKKIHFSNYGHKEQTIANINMSTAFIPDGLIDVGMGKFDDVQADNLKKPEDIHIAKWDDKLNQFNRALGALALMRLAGEEYMNYSENYFATLSFFNMVIQRDFEKTKIEPNLRFRGIFSGESGFSKIIPYLRKSISESDIESIAHEENQIIKKDPVTKIIDLNSLDKTWTYTIAVLNTYGVDNESKKKRVDELILSNFKMGIKYGKSEGIALCYGFNRGYSAFANKYGFDKNEKKVKFQLNSKLDYYTIESVFQWAVNDVKSKEFPYLDWWCPKQMPFKASSNTDYQILDVVVIGKKKASVLSREYLDNSLHRYFQKDKVQLFEAMFRELIETVYRDTREEIADGESFYEGIKQQAIDNQEVAKRPSTSENLVNQTKSSRSRKQNNKGHKGRHNEIKKDTISFPSESQELFK